MGQHYNSLNNTLRLVDTAREERSVYANWRADSDPPHIVRLGGDCRVSVLAKIDLPT
ncbi:hypothetical protein SAMN05661093_09189 [Kibdelosporangium aridum]|uniref:Uncharacterized protein n=1 Tax=Kibdelosporangium aridum TaxID=2030 RepID=A0A1W2FUB2_KIBAR|nr:hypothetical protein SAMN05661093_09189 [Kibdelosporangium aridum]